MGLVRKKINVLLVLLLSLFVGESNANSIDGLIDINVRSAKTHQMVATKMYKDNSIAAMEGKSIVFIIVGVYLLASLLPSAITQLNAANTTGWSATQVAIWSVISIIIIAAIIVKLSE